MNVRSGRLRLTRKILQTLLSPAALGVVALVHALVASALNSDVPLPLYWVSILLFALAVGVVFVPIAGPLHGYRKVPLALLAIGLIAGLLTAVPPHLVLIFGLYAGAWLVAARGDTALSAVVAQILLAIALFLALLDNLDQLLKLDLLYPAYHQFHVHTPLAVGMVILGVGYWSAIAASDCYRTFYRREDRRITGIGIALLLFTAASAGLTGFGIMVHTIEGVVKEGFGLSLRDRAKEIESAIQEAIDLTVLTQQQIALAANERYTPSRQLHLANPKRLGSYVVGAIGAERLSGAAITDARGRVLAKYGASTPDPRLSHPLTDDHGLMLLWADRTVLRAKLPLWHADRKTGYLITEIAIPAMDRLLMSGSGLGESGSMLVCVPHVSDVACFPNRQQGVVVARRMLNGQPLPIDYALTGNIGFAVAPDLLRHEVLSAYRPVGDTGLGMVLKIRADELYAPIRKQFTIMLLVVAALIGLGLVLFRARITPIARRLAHETHERERAESELNKLSFVLEKSPMAVVIANSDGRIEYINPSFTNLTGYEPEETLGRTPGEMVQSGRTAPDTYKKMWGNLTAGEGWTGEIENRDKNGNYYWVHQMIQPVFSRDGKITHYLSMQQDITDRKVAESRLNFLANHDPLTGLPNRTLFNHRLQVAMADAERSERLVGIMFLDLDRFKTVNDTLGHTAGDELLRQVTQRLNTCVRRGDTISRLGGDEFILVLADVGHVNDLVHVAHKILDALSTPHMIAGKEIYIGASIGITVYPFDDRDPESLVRNADAAMYLAKESGRNTFQFYTSELNERASKRLTLESTLRRAIERQEFCLHYQPQIDMRSGRIFGVEALIRWNQPDIGMVSPAEFIPMAEETGLIVPIGEWVLQEACTQGSAWHAMGFDTLNIAVNLSSRQFQDRNLTNMLDAILRATKMDPSRLDLEITESVLITNVDAAISMLEAMRRLGVSCSLDDFGTGYSSLNYLRKLPLDRLKLDRSFVQDCTISARVAALAEGIIDMAQALGFKVIAEGVETAAQIDFLRARGCDAVQGYHISLPLPADQMTTLLGRHALAAEASTIQ